MSAQVRACPSMLMALRDPADEFLRNDALSRPYSRSECDHIPTCGNGLAHYERTHGIMLDNGPAEGRARYHESPGGFMDQDDLARAATRERTYTPERNKKRRRGSTERRFSDCTE